MHNRKFEAKKREIVLQQRPELGCFTALGPTWQTKQWWQAENLISERALEHLSFQLSSQDLSSLVLGQGFNEHDSGAELLVGGDPLCHPVDDGLLHDVAVFPDDVGSRKLAGSLIRHSNN